MTLTRIVGALVVFVPSFLAGCGLLFRRLVKSVGAALHHFEERER